MLQRTIRRLLDKVAQTLIKERQETSPEVIPRWPVEETERRGDTSKGGVCRL
jgi:hypothetical protein